MVDVAPGECSDPDEGSIPDRRSQQEGEHHCKWTLSDETHKHGRDRPQPR
ncbi:uncharacterized protein METZ01_LOCUS20461 [marine metagenome]|uniref:Uncharacterized protein n=1 Tax=marine metagenome TaxID=408172 RepID=A0A381PNA8_9ZZZZ